MGYSNEVGEAFVAFLPGWGVPASYGVAGTYC
jgi:fission process protein 1